MEIVIIAIVAIGVIGWWIWKESKHTSGEQHPLDGATKHSVLDVNNDGKVDVNDAVVVAEVVVEKTKKTAAAAKTAVAKIKAPAKKASVKPKSPKKPKAK